MLRNKTLANRLREVFLNGKWIANTNYKLQIEDLTWKQSIQQIQDLNTIAVLIYHVNYYLAGILNVFNGGKLEIRDKYSFDLPPITSEADWKNLVAEFLLNSEKFANHIENMEDSQLDAPFVDEKYGTYQKNIEGVIEHSYYHLGQISLIKKMVLEKESA
ncbi:DinB family protein [Aquimarina sp. 2201CG1-2-11]|uniref:DinB family protein n=1 Tax=Aquimarina discodermiae TaxID=3231043 RepID=UPI003462D80C